MHEKTWQPELKSFSASVKEPGNLILRLFNYPAWKTVVNGRTVSPETTEDTGQMIVPIRPGANEVTITLARTWDRSTGAVISGLAVALGAILLWADHRRVRAS